MKVLSRQASANICGTEIFKYLSHIITSDIDVNTKGLK
jgi:hypothetical protein